jgi:hypothetical protein
MIRQRPGQAQPQRPHAPEDVADRQPITAYEIYPQVDMPLIPAPINRTWMDETQSRFAYRCLPLTLANQAGWMVCNPKSFSARWNGGARASDTVLAFDECPPDDRITSLFGHGTVTFNLPYLVRTPPEVNLWVKGPTNWPKHGTQALEGIVETDWTAASFTMNWKLTRPHEAVRFERGEPICMIVPYPRQMIDQLAPLPRPLDDNPELAADYRRWSAERDAFHQSVADGDQEAIRHGWQKDYFQGRDPGRDPFQEHQTRLAVPTFRRVDNTQQPDRPEELRDNEAR